MSKPPRSAGKSAFVIMVAVLGSRILGLVREMVLNSIFGLSHQLDAFYAAFRIPNLLRDLFAEGALSTAFVTTFSKKLTTDGKAAAFRLANLVLSTLSVFMLGICVLGIVFSGQLVLLLSPGFADIPGQVRLTTDLTRILFPFIGLVSLAALYMGLLNSLGSFGLPASASTVFNFTSILSGLACGWCFDPHFGPRSIYGFAIGTVIGGFFQLAIQIPKACSLGYHPAWLWSLRDPDLQRVFKLMTPAVVGGAAVQVNVMVNGFFASYLAEGSVTALNNAFRLMQLPIGLFGVAIATVTLPSVSQSAARSDFSAFRLQLGRSLRQAFFLTLPASTGLALLSVPIIRLIFERGRFSADDTQITAMVLEAYAGGLAFYAAIKVLAPVFYALDKPQIPFRVSVLGILLNLGFNLLFLKVFHLGLVSLPVTTSMIALLNFLQLYFMINREVGSVFIKNDFSAIFRIILACAVMSLVVSGLGYFAGSKDHGFILNALILALQIILGAASYAGAAWLLRIREIRMVTQQVMNKLFHKKK